ncbi:hypothetical protein AGMMS49925_10440 [Deltaproteobacteria bacterium]|nr:hypothetical protein AGMMS49925_10440 [Deltaproteobacteria bacterium]
MLHVFSRFRLLLGIVLALLFLAAAACWFLQRNFGYFAQQYLDKLSVETGLAIRAQSVRVSLWHAPSFVARTFSVESADMRFSAAKVILCLDLFALLRGKVVLKSLLLAQPAVKGEVAPDDARRLAAFFAAPTQGEAFAPSEKLRLTIEQGEADLAGKDTVRLQLSGMDCDLSVLQSKAGGWRVKADVRGVVAIDGARTPFSLGGVAVTRGRSNQGGRLVGFEDIDMRLGGDSARLNAVLTRHDADAAGFGLAGSLHVQRVSLTRWLGFARNLSPGLQWALDNVTDAVLDFSLDGRGLSVPHIEASVAGGRFTGSGGVRTWANPEVALDLTADRLRLEAGIPEAVGRLPRPPDFPHAPLTPMPGEPLKPGEIGVNYNIRLGARTLDYASVAFENAGVAITQGKQDENGLEDTLLTADARFCGGSLHGEAVFGGGHAGPYAVNLRFRDVDGAAASEILTVLPLNKGRLRGDVQLTSQGRSIAEFLERLRARVDVVLTQGALLLPDAGSAGEARAGTLDIRSLVVSVDAHSGVWEKGRLALNGQWSSVLEAAGCKLRSELAGTLSFGGSADEGTVFFNNCPGVFSLQFVSADWATLQGVSAELKGNFSLRECKQVEVGNARLSIPGIEVSGNIQLGGGSDGAAFKGAVVVRSKDMGQLARLFGVTGAYFLSSACELTLDTDIRGGMRAVTLGNLRAVVDQTKVTGSFSAVWREQPNLEFDLAADAVNADRFFSDRKEKTNKKSSAGKAWDLRFLRGMHVKGALRVDRLALWGLNLRDVMLPVLLENGHLVCSPVKAGCYGSTLHGKSVMDFDRGLCFAADFSVDGAEMTAASKDVGGGVVLGGKVGLSAAISGVLGGPGQMPSALNGAWRFLVRDGSYQKRGGDGEGKGKAIEFATAGASGDIKAGVARSNDFALQGKGLAMNGGGVVDLNSDAVDCNFIVNMPGVPEIPIRLHGGLRDSKTTVSVGKVILNTLGAVPKGIFDVLGDVVQGAWKLLR